MFDSQDRTFSNPPPTFCFEYELENWESQLGGEVNVSCFIKISKSWSINCFFTGFKYKKKYLYKYYLKTDVKT